MVIQKLSKIYAILVFLAGALSVFAFAPFDFYPLIFLSPAVLFYALSKATTKKQYFYLSWLFGIGLFGAGASWPFYSIYFFAHAPLPVALLGVTLFVVLVALLAVGLFGLLAAQFRYTPLALRFLVFYPVSWVFMEWVRGWLLTGFPWLYFGNSLIDSIFSSFAPIAGVLGVSFVSVLITGALLTLFFGGVIKCGTIKRSTQLFSVILILCLITTAFILQSVQWTKKIKEPLQVSVLQSNISQNEKLDYSKRDWALQRYIKMTEQSQNSDLIVWPETGLFDAFNRHMDSLIIPLQESLKENKSVLLGGFFINEAKGVENSVLALSATHREIYSKRHLVPFGEYIPLVSYFRWMGDWIPRSNLTAGKSDGTLSVAGGVVAQMSICYEDAFGSELIQSLPEATLLINMTHDGWFTGSLEPAQHMQIARMRALETGRYMVRATTTGPSGIINEKGEVIATAPVYTQKIITHDVQLFTGLTPYAFWGNWLIVSFLSACLLLGFIWQKWYQKRD